MTATTAQPFPETQLRLLTKEACESTLGSATSYQHASTEAWNSSIINKILNSLISSSPTTASTSEPTPSQKTQYKYAVNSTIIQHLAERGGSASVGTSTSTGGSRSGNQTASPPRTPTEGSAGESEGSGSVVPTKERRGMHSATGAYWNNETDGMFTYKYDGGDAKGMDVVISVLWVAV